ncbi:transglycosylase SLT domain-containing protein [Leeia sp. TBRC 13508]|uniref:Transglycosylase SLT domain-containing protein n=1 Tax=Leeia speluncae TaxID=2884804 RepID=A0ABS8D8J9_9NEIS|nr:lytic transglycosylase domain-containing protein [Leeia speluncae]MCB6184452.1 transglycosylase SLT domain-containing protein [Leeia speluncae]
MSICLLPLCSFANANEVDSPQQQSWLLEATRLETSDPWKAAVKYCTAARSGSTEAQYRLAMLFAFGQGVPEDRDAAASLLAIAAQQGHQEAVNMLETIHFGSDKLPGCVLADSLPPKNPLKPGPTLEGQLAKLPKDKRWIVEMVQQVARWNDVDPRLALSIVSVESNFNVQATSNANAQGLMQLIPATAERFNVRNAYNASQNVKGGVRYLRWLLDRYNGNVELVAAAYNAGEGAVDKYKGVPPYKETQDYVAKVLRYYPKSQHQKKMAQPPSKLM